jgi:hypothetical protein
MLRSIQSNYDEYSTAMYFPRDGGGGGGGGGVTGWDGSTRGSVSPGGPGSIAYVYIWIERQSGVVGAPPLLPVATH